MLEKERPGEEKMIQWLSGRESSDEGDDSGGDDKVCRMGVLSRRDVHGSRIRGHNETLEWRG